VQVAYEDKGLILTFDKGKLINEEPLNRSPYEPLDFDSIPPPPD